MNSLLRTFISYVWGFRIQNLSSELNGRLEVWYISGKYRLDSWKANYSFGSLHRLFQKVFREINLAGRNPESILLLGLGAGSVVSILRDELKMTTRITGVEHDDEIIQLAREYFAIDRYPGLTIVQEDAAQFVSANNQKFDCIVIDLFNDRDVPEKFIQRSFLDDCFHHLSENGILIFNFIAANVRQKEEFEELKRNFKAQGKEFRILELLGENKVIIVD
jgi:spermidine synthase